MSSSPATAAGEGTSPAATAPLTAWLEEVNTLRGEGAADDVVVDVESVGDVAVEDVVEEEPLANCGGVGQSPFAWKRKKRRGVREL